MITVLFADLAGFTTRAERLDPEDVRAILTLYYGRLRTEIQAFGGTVEKFIGDAVMAVFGAPIAHGDDPERAVRAALAVRDAIAEMNDADPELDLQVRTAVNTGEALVALDASVGEGEGMAAGDVVNTAARLQTAAPVNGVLVGEETYRCTKSIITYQGVDSIRAKGKQAPVPAWLALAAPSAPGERAPGRVRMLGRHHELRTLAGIWNQVVEQRRPHLVTVFGPPGIGKTRLATEFADVVVGNGGRTIRGRSLPYGDSAAYGAFAHQVKELGGIFDSDEARVACEKLERTVGTLIESDDAGEVASHIAMLIGFGTEGGVDDRETLFSSARRLVEALARRQPTVLLFEDIHWADASLLDLLELLAESVRDVPLLLLTLARPDLLASRAELGRQPARVHGASARGTQRSGRAGARGSACCMRLRRPRGRRRGRAARRDGRGQPALHRGARRLARRGRDGGGSGADEHPRYRLGPPRRASGTASARSFSTHRWSARSSGKARSRASAVSRTRLRRCSTRSRSATSSGARPSRASRATSSSRSSTY